MSEKPLEWRLLERAAATIQRGAFSGYFELKHMLQGVLEQPESAQRDDFRVRFSNYFRLNIGGLTDEFKQTYFDLLFDVRPHGQRDPYTALLLKLYELPRQQGDRALQASFVTKLVAIHDDSLPIYDRHVSNFFGMSLPGVGPVDFRVAG